MDGRLSPLPVITQPATPPSQIVCCQPWAGRYHSAGRTMTTASYCKCTIRPIWKHDVIHKTKNKYHSVLSWEENRATFTGNVYKKFHEILPVSRSSSDENAIHVRYVLPVFEICERTDRHTYRLKDRHTDKLIAIFRPPTGGEVITLNLKAMSLENVWDTISMFCVENKMAKSY